jgi:two-component system sensor kinase FixL
MSEDAVPTSDSAEFEPRLDVSQHFTQRVLAAAPVFIYIFDLPTRSTLYLNQAAQDFLGYDREELQAEGPALLRRLVHPDDVQRVTEHHTRMATARDDEVREVEYRMRHACGQWRWLRGREAVFSRDAHGAVRQILGAAEDVTGRKQTEQSLRESHETLQALLNATAEMAYLIDAQGMLQAFNETLAERLGKDPAELAGHCIYDFLPPPLARCQRDIALQVLGSGRPVHFQEMYDERQLEGMAWPVRDLEGRVTSLAIYSRDVTQQRRAEEALRSSEAKFRSYIEHAPLAVFVVDEAGQYLEVNTTACAMFGYTEQEFQALSLRDLFAAADPLREELLKRAVEDPQAGQELQLRRKDGSLFWGGLRAVRLSPGRLLAFVADTTELKAAQLAQQQLQLQLAHMGRVATVGEMIAGIAHEVNQPLYSIVNYAKASTNLLSQSEPRIDELRECNKEIAAAAVRAADIIARLRTFLSRAESRRAAANLRELIEETLGLVAHQTQHRSVSVHTEFDAANLIVEVDRVQIQQVLVNLLQNAWESLEENPTADRRLAIRTMRDGCHVEVSVADNGPGLQPLPAARLFEPFVTTKRKGLGVGLSISKTIVQAHGGRIWADETPGGGATFHFTLPLLEEKSHHAR